MLSSLFILSQLLMVACGLYLFLSKRGSNGDPFSIAVPFTAFYVLEYVVRGFDLYNGRNMIFGGTLDDQPERLLYISSLALFGYMAFLCGFILKKKGGKRGAAAQWVSGAAISIKKLIICHVAILGLSVMAVIVLLFRAQVTPWEYMSNLNYYRLNVNNDVAYLKFLINISGLTGTLYFALCNEKGRSKSIILLVIPFLLNFFFAHRHFAVFYAFALMAVHHYLVRRFSLRSVLSVALITFFLNGMFSAYRDFKYVFPDKELSWSALIDTYSDDAGFVGLVVNQVYLAGLHGFDSVHMITNAVDNGESYHYGLRFLIEPIAGAIPYSVWRDKPIPLNTAVNNLMNGEPIDYYDPTERSGGVVGTVLGDLYWAGGVTGILLGMFFMGRIFKAVDSFSATKKAFPVFVYAAYYPIFFMFISTIGSGLIRLVYFSIFIALMYFTVKVNRLSLSRRSLPKQSAMIRSND